MNLTIEIFLDEFRGVGSNKIMGGQNNYAIFNTLILHKVQWMGNAYARPGNRVGCANKDLQLFLQSSGDLRGVTRNF